MITPRPVRSRRDVILLVIVASCLFATGAVGWWWYQVQQQRQLLVAQTSDLTLLVTRTASAANTTAVKTSVTAPASGAAVLQHPTIRVLRYYAPAVTVTALTQGNRAPFQSLTY